MDCGMVSTLGSGLLGGFDWKKATRVQRAKLVVVLILVKTLSGAEFWISWMRSLTSMDAFSTEEVAGIVKVVGRNLAVLPKHVPLVART